MILSSDQIDHFSPIVGIKTKNLAQLQKAGFFVPKFVAIPSTVLNQFLRKSTDISSWDLTSLLVDIKENLLVRSYAVRSSALIEDSAQHSYAGQFLTKIDQSLEQLEQALKEVILQAFDYLHGDLAKFSVIIQEYIHPDFAGVTFTRAPEGGREMVIEYHQGKGEELVGGKISPQQLRFYWHQNIARSPLPDFAKAFENFKKIETLFGFAQDIEWAVKDNLWYFLQARPLTTLTKKHYGEALFLDRTLPQKKDFLFEKTEISEIAPRPTALTKSILERIYADGGPVQKVYDKHGVVFEARSFLNIVANELYVDREEEVKTLLPAYSILGRIDYQPHIISWKGSVRTLRNIMKLNFLSLKNKKQLYDRLFEFLEKPLAADLSLAFNDFITDYECIFEINLFAQKSLKSAEMALRQQKNIPFVLPELLQATELKYDQTSQLPKSFDQEQWQGNSLEVADQTPFISAQTFSVASDRSSQVQLWLNKLPAFKKKYLLDILYEARFFNQLREEGRWLTVRHIHHLRQLVLTIAKKQNVSLEDILFATIQEILTQNFLPEVLQKRRSDYESFNDHNLPSKLSGVPIMSVGKCLGVSQGIAKGVLTDVAHLTTTENPIIFTSLLSPDLAQHFKSIRGILSEQGGMLSHLAIIARETNIPVIVNVDLDRLGLQYGDRVEIDGATGEIKKLS